MRSRARADARDLEPRGAGFDGVADACEDVVPDVAGPAAVVVAEEDEAWGCGVGCDLFCAEASEGPGDEWRARGGEVCCWFGGGVFEGVGRCCCMGGVWVGGLGYAVE